MPRWIDREPQVRASRVGNAALFVRAEARERERLRVYLAAHPPTDDGACQATTWRLGYRHRCIRRDEHRLHVSKGGFAWR